MEAQAWESQADTLPLQASHPSSWDHANNQWYHLHQAGQLPDGAATAGGAAAAAAEPGAQRRHLQDPAQDADTRYQPSTTRAFPYNAIALVTYDVVQTGERGVCTGTFVSGYDVLLSADCLTDILDPSLNITNFVVTPGQDGLAAPFGQYRPLFTTWYRSEYNTGAGLLSPTVQYYDLGVMRLGAVVEGSGGSLPYHSYLGFKYDCSQALFKASACGYPLSKQDNVTLAAYQWCSDCSFASSSCQPGAMVTTHCGSAEAGMAGAAIMDLADRKALGVLSGADPHLPAGSGGFSVWTPITKEHFQALERWLWDGENATRGVPPSPPAPPPPPEDYQPERCLGTLEGEVRLVPMPQDGSSTRGRLEVCFNGYWGGVCSKNWGYAEAVVACRQLGIPGLAEPVANVFGSLFAGQPIWVSGVECRGDEVTIGQCSQALWQNLEGCFPQEAAGVVCNATAFGVGSMAGQADAALQYGNYSCAAEGALRLVPGATLLSGRLEVCHEGQWGAVCDDHWDNADATVACRSLSPTQYQYGIALPGSSTADSASDMRFWRSRVNCSGSEASFGLCNFPLDWGVAACSPAEAAGVSCSNAPMPAGSGVPKANDTCGTDGEVRLAPVPSLVAPLPAGASAVVAGRVEVCYDQRWGALCADAWDVRDAEVVCRQLGYGYPLTLTTNSSGGGPIWGRQAQCAGTEPALARCAMWGLGPQPACPAPAASRGAFAAAACATGAMRLPPPPPSPFACATDGAVRLVGGALDRRTGQPISGRVEVCKAGQWGTICSDAFTPTEARVVCQGMGYAHGAPTPGFGAGPAGQRVWLNQVRCAGDEDNIWACNMTSLSLGTITQVPAGGTLARCLAHAYDLGVLCGYTAAVMHSPSPPPPAVPSPPRPPAAPGVSCSGSPMGSVRLVRPSWSGDIGLLEVCYGANTTRAQWGTVCSTRFGQPEADVACRQLGYTRGSVLSPYLASTMPRSSAGAPQWMDALNCIGSEARIVDCSFPGYGVLGAGCSADHAAGVACFRDLQLPPPPPSPPPSVRPAGLDCPAEGALRLVDASGLVVHLMGAAQVFGMLQLCMGGSWGSVCDRTWDAAAASVACQQLGFTAALAAYSAAQLKALGYGDGTLHPAGMLMAMTRVHCLGYEQGLSRCEYERVQGDPACPASNSEAGVLCSIYAAPGPPPSPPAPPGPTSPAAPGRECMEQGAARLVDGPSAAEGRLEVCDGRVWGTVCENGWSDQLTSLVCRQLGFPSGGVVYSGGAGALRFRGAAASTPVALDPGLFSGMCDGSEDGLADCVPSQAFGLAGECNHSMDIGLSCAQPGQLSRLPLRTSPSDLACDPAYPWAPRVVGGPLEGTGNLELCIGSRWSLVCASDATWDDTAANVACRSIGFSGGYLPGPTYGQDPAPFGGPVEGQVYAIATRTAPCSRGDEHSLKDCAYDVVPVVTAAECAAGGPARVVCLSDGPVAFPPPPSPPPSPPEPPSPPPPPPPSPRPPPPPPPPPPFPPLPAPSPPEFTTEVLSAPSPLLPPPPQPPPMAPPPKHPASPSPPPSPPPPSPPPAPPRPPPIIPLKVKSSPPPSPPGPEQPFPPPAPPTQPPMHPPLQPPTQPSLQPPPRPSPPPPWVIIGSVAETTTGSRKRKAKPPSPPPPKRKKAKAAKKRKARPLLPPMPEMPPVASPPLPSMKRVKSKPPPPLSPPPSPLTPLPPWPPPPRKFSPPPSPVSPPPPKRRRGAKRPPPPLPPTTSPHASTRVIVSFGPGPSPPLSKAARNALARRKRRQDMRGE